MKTGDPKRWTDGDGVTWWIFGKYLVRFETKDGVVKRFTKPRTVMQDAIKQWLKRPNNQGTGGTGAAT